MIPFDTAAHGGYLTRAELVAHGHDDREIRAAVRLGQLVRIRHGVYAYAADHAMLGPEQRHAVIARSVAAKLGPGVAISHQSACALLGLSMYGHDLSDVHVTRLDGSAGRHEHGIVHHVGHAVRDDDVQELDGVLVMRPARAVFEAGLIGSVESAIVVMDSALHRGLVTTDDLRRLGEQTRSWQGARGARYALSLADGRAASPGESRSRYLFRREGLPIPQLQFPVHDAAGRLLGYTDFAWEEYRHLGEFDGFVKYGGIPNDTRTPQHVVFDEKTREDLIRRQLWGMSRWIWSELDTRRAHATAQRIRAELDQSRALYTRSRTYFPLG